MIPNLYQYSYRSCIGITVQFTIQFTIQFTVPYSASTRDSLLGRELDFPHFPTHFSPHTVLLPLPEI